MTSIVTCPQHGKCECDAAAGASFKFMVVSAVWRQNIIVNTFEDACKLVANKKSKVEKIFQIIEKETEELEFSRDQHLRTKEMRSKYAFNGIRSKYMVKYSCPTFNQHLLEDKYVLKTKSSIDPDGPWEETAVALIKSTIQFRKEEFRWPCLE